MTKRNTIKQRIREAARIAAEKHGITQKQVRELLTYWADEENAGMRDMDMAHTSAKAMAREAAHYIKWFERDGRVLP